MARTYLLWGSAGTGKTSFALADATPDNPAWYAELEPGGFRRSAPRLNLAEGAVNVHAYPTPMQELETLLSGIPTLGGQGGLHADFSYQLDGWTELLNNVVTGMMAAVKAGQRPIFDTATRYWYIIRQCYEEMVQKATGANIEKIGQLKFTWPNKIMLQSHEFPLSYGLDVIWIAHQDTVFNSDPPIYKADTWKELPNMVDVSLQFRVSNNMPVAKIVKGAESGMALQGLEIVAPTLSKLNAILDLAAILQKEGKPIEKDAELLLGLAKMDGLI